MTYTNEAKAKLLGIDPTLIEEKGRSEREVAKAMAENVRALLGTDIGVGVTGLRAPTATAYTRSASVFVSPSGRGRDLCQGTAHGRHAHAQLHPPHGNHIYDMTRRWLSGIDVM